MAPQFERVLIIKDKLMRFLDFAMDVPGIGGPASRNCLIFEKIISGFPKPKTIIIIADRLAEARKKTIRMIVLRRSRFTMNRFAVFAVCFFFFFVPESDKVSDSKMRGLIFSQARDHNDHRSKLQNNKNHL